MDAVTIGYAIFYTTVIGCAAVIVAMVIVAVFRVKELFSRPSTPKKIVTDQTFTKSLEPNGDYWICPYCQSENDKTAFSCAVCGSPRKQRDSS